MDMTHTPPTFEEADALLTEIIAFLLDCGGIYTERTGDLETTILQSIATGQYLLHRNEHQHMTHFLCYRHDDNGVMHILEHGNKDGRAGLTRIIKEIKQVSAGKQGVSWNSKGRGVKSFLKKKGTLTINQFD